MSLNKSGIIALALLGLTAIGGSIIGVSGKHPGVAGEAMSSGWFSAGSDPDDYSIGADRNVRHSGKASGYIKSKGLNPKGFGTLMQMSRADDYRGKRVRMSAYIKSEKIEGWAGMWMRIDGPESKTLSFDNMADRPIKGTTNWGKYEVVLDVPGNSEYIAFGILLRGKGQAWIDDIQFEIVGSDVKTTGNENKYPKRPINLNFED